MFDCNLIEVVTKTGLTNLIEVVTITKAGFTNFFFCNLFIFPSTDLYIHDS
jgi:hypothetical protein